MTKKVAALAKAGVLAIDASNDNFGDPASGHVKKLHVDYSVNGVTASKTVREQETLTITATSTPPAIVDAICERDAERPGARPGWPCCDRCGRPAGPRPFRPFEPPSADNDRPGQGDRPATSCATGPRPTPCP